MRPRRRSSTRPGGTCTWPTSSYVTRPQSCTTCRRWCWDNWDMASFAELQAEHERLLRQGEDNADPAEVLAAVKADVARARAESGTINAPRDRDQLRANLRFWGAFLFDRTGEYPDTTLRPAQGGPAALPD